MSPIRRPARPRSRFNLSEWALHHRPLVLYLIVVCALAGVLAYGRLGQSEDPPFTFKVMVVRTNWPGASAREVEQQVTDRIERKLQEVPHRLGAQLLEAGRVAGLRLAEGLAPPARCPRPSYQVRKKVGDIRNTLPAGIQGPFFNDEFGDTYTNIYAITGDGFGYRELKEFGDRIRAELLRVPGVAKVDFIGEQDEKIFVELSNAQARARWASSPAQIFADARRAERGRRGRRVRDRRPTASTCGRPAPSTRSTAIRDIAHPRQRPPVPAGRHRDGRRAATSTRRSRRCAGRAARRSGIGVTMVDGRRRDRARARARRARSRASRPQLPVGVEIEQVASMPRAVAALGQRVRALARRGGAIVLAVSLREPRPAHRARGRGVDPAGARDHLPRACGCSASACTRSRSAR